MPIYGVIVYPVMAKPPFDAGAVQLTLAWPLPAVATTFVGAPGTVPTLTAFEWADSAPVPAVLIALTVNVYVDPFCSELTVAPVGVAGSFTGVPAVGPIKGVIV